MLSSWKEFGQVIRRSGEDFATRKLWLLLRFCSTESVTRSHGFTGGLVSRMKEAGQNILINGRSLRSENVRNLEVFVERALK